ncbi:MAG TPA: dockerin type I domain-containing protein [Gemmatimonadaceae bacterium]|nr:dockerin type I domain-containing protein [Gemmatimonadaceae bacterium]
MAVLGHRYLGRQALSLIGLGSVVGFASLPTPLARARRAEPGLRTGSMAAAGVTAPLVTSDELRLVEDSLRGHSGKLLIRLVARDRDSLAVPLFERLFGDSAIDHPGLYAVPDSALPQPFHFISLRPFAEKLDGRLGNYRLGFWPKERGRRASEAYDNPAGFIEVTPETQDTQISEHFRLRDFLTHDQPDVWPKYLVLNEELVDKLELVIADLQLTGIPVRHMTVMSGFRTPWYNRHGGETGGRAGLSRHMYGDAADVFVDNGNGRMADLNRDGRVDSRDARVLRRAVERVEREYPDLVGGVGVYRSTRSHGPFAHVDVRGWRARWGRS